MLILSNKSKACFKRRILHVPNTTQTISNVKTYLIIYCLNCIRCMQNSTSETGLNYDSLNKQILHWLDSNIVSSTHYLIC